MDLDDLFSDNVEGHPGFTYTGTFGVPDTFSSDDNSSNEEGPRSNTSSEHWFRTPTPPVEPVPPNGSSPAIRPMRDPQVSPNTLPPPVGPVPPNGEQATALGPRSDTSGTISPLSFPSSTIPVTNPTNGEGSAERPIPPPVEPPTATTAVTTPRPRRPWRGCCNDLFWCYGVCMCLFVWVYVCVCLYLAYRVFPGLFSFAFWLGWLRWLKALAKFMRSGTMPPPAPANTDNATITSTMAEVVSQTSSTPLPSTSSLPSSSPPPPPPPPSSTPPPSDDEEASDDVPAPPASTVWEAKIYTFYHQEVTRTVRSL
ncbi:uncharacterized protein PG986_005046 [Apiospora aurea]|uniref:Uncharacterized protein n=1 Tax=Apiospora aurea TaxID=335848 RepID=A0ABR1QGF0_9PEZI